MYYNGRTKCLSAMSLKSHDRKSNCDSPCSFIWFIFLPRRHTTFFERKKDCFGAVMSKQCLYLRLKNLSCVLVVTRILVIVPIILLFRISLVETVLLCRFVKLEIKAIYPEISFENCFGFLGKVLPVFLTCLVCKSSRS